MKKIYSNFYILLLIISSTLSIKSMEQESAQPNSLKNNAALIVLESVQDSKEEIDKLNIPDELKDYTKLLVDIKYILGSAWDKKSYKLIEDIINLISNPIDIGLQFDYEKLKVFLNELTAHFKGTKAHSDSDKERMLELLFNLLIDKSYKINNRQLFGYESIMTLARFYKQETIISIIEIAFSNSNYDLIPFIGGDLLIFHLQVLITHLKKIPAA